MTHCIEDSIKLTKVVSDDRYLRARSLEQEAGNHQMVLNSDILPHWIEGSNCFWYIRKFRNKGSENPEIIKQFRLVNADDANNTEAFNHRLLASALAQTAGQEVDYRDLPISDVQLQLFPVRVMFTAFGQRWLFDTSTDNCEQLPIKSNSQGVGELLSPDGKKVAFSRDFNLWVRDVESGQEYAMTHDGERHYAYGIQPESRDLLEGLPGNISISPITLEALWSPDSRKLFTLKTDERQVRSVPSMLYVPQDGTVAPKVVERKYALPGDKHIVLYRMFVIDVDTCKLIEADYPPIEDAFVSYSPFNGNTSVKSNLTWWSSDSCQAYFVDMTRGQKTARVIAFDANSGATNSLFEETTDTYLDLIPHLAQPSMLTPLPDTNELIWFSERSGWAHLYLYDLTSGQLKNAITSGEWRVHDIVHMDNTTRTLFIQIAGRIEGRNPYYRELVRVNIDSGEMIIIASSNHDYCTYHPPMHDSGISPDGDYVVTTRSRVDAPAVTELRDRSGKLILEIETANTEGLPSGWQWPEPISMKAADDTTDIYGVIFRPTDFDPENTYPILDFGMDSPFYAHSPRGAFLTEGWDPIANIYYTTFAALAELGFIVTVIDGRGTPYRSKEFHNFGYESFMSGGGIVDHVAGIKQLAKRYPYMDVNNVGIITTDAAGNGPLFGLLNHPDFYKVGIAFSTWDPRLVRQGEIYHESVRDSDTEKSLWADAVGNLQGKLFLITGLLDQVFHSSMTFQVVDALVKANKDFDLLIHPNGGHGHDVINAHRRAWDYLVKHLQGRLPPKDFTLTTGFHKM